MKDKVRGKKCRENKHFRCGLQGPGTRFFSLQEEEASGPLTLTTFSQVWALKELELVTDQNLNRSLLN